MSVALHRFAERMLAELDKAVPVRKPRIFHILLKEVWLVLASDNLKPFMALWLDLSSGAARGLQPHLDVAGQIADGFLVWTTSRLKVEAPGNHAASAALFLSSIEGMYILEAVGRPSIARSAATALSATRRNAPSR